MERKVCNFFCLLALCLFCPFFQVVLDIKVLLSAFNCPPFSWQRREKIERRQQEVETELKMCKSLSFSHMSSSNPHVFLSPRSTLRACFGKVGLLVHFLAPLFVRHYVYFGHLSDRVWSKGWQEGRVWVSWVCALEGLPQSSWVSQAEAVRA